MQQTLPWGHTADLTGGSILLRACCRSGGRARTRGRRRTANRRGAGVRGRFGSGAGFSGLFGSRAKVRDVRSRFRSAGIRSGGFDFLRRQVDGRRPAAGRAVSLAHDLSRPDRNPIRRTGYVHAPGIVRRHDGGNTARKTVARIENQTLRLRD